MKNYIYQNNLIGKKQLRQILGWSFTNYDSMQACTLADELKYIGFKYATQAGISISIEDLRVPFIKNLMLEKANQEIINSEKIYLKGKITDVERFQKIIDTWSLTSESLKDQVISYFKKYDPLNSVYIMAFSGARGNLSQVRQLVGMRGLMSDPSGEIMNLPIKKNFREGLTITDYLMSGYGARKGIVDTALKTANSGYLTRRLIDVAQDILIREKDCNTKHSFLMINNQNIINQIIGRVLNKTIKDLVTSKVVAFKNIQITPTLINNLNQKKISQFYVRSPLTCQLYRALCQQCYGWDLATENLVDIGEAVGILAGQSIGEPGTQLTMRTFHTGGIFTSETRQQLINPTNGIIQFSKFLETVVLRTNRGEDVLVTKNSGFLILIPESEEKNIIKIEILRNTIIFPKHNQFVQKDTVLGELINTNKQLKREIKPILSNTPGEVIVPKLKTRINSLNNNKLLWVLSGELFNSPINSYVNFYSDHKLNKNSFIFRTKIISSYSGKIFYKNNIKTLYKFKIIIKNNTYSLKNSKFFQLYTKIGSANNLLTFENSSYLCYTSLKNFKTYLKTTRKNHFAHLITNIYRTNTGGILYYDYRTKNCQINTNLKMFFYKEFENNQIFTKDINHSTDLNPLNFEDQKIFSRQLYRTLIWLEEETHTVNCEPNILLVKDGDFIAKNFEITPGHFSKISGLVEIQQKNNIIKMITVRSGLVYEGNPFSDHSKKVYFPGEQIFSNITISLPSLCERISLKNGNQLLVRSIQLYEFPHAKSIVNIFKEEKFIKKNLKILTNLHSIYSSRQKIRSKSSINLALEGFSLDIPSSLTEKLSIELKKNKIRNIVEFKIGNQINLNNHVLPQLKYKNLKSCPLIQKNQFIDRYTILSYLEAVTLNSLEIVKFKVNQGEIKQIFLISNDNCIVIKKDKLSNKKLNEFILNSTSINHVGKIIIENSEVFTVQKGRPYFFPNCQADSLIGQTNLNYKFLPIKRNKKQELTNKNIFLNHFTRFKTLIETNPGNYWERNSHWKSHVNEINLSLKVKFSKMFLRKNGKLYSCMIPRFLKQFNISSNPTSRNLLSSNLFTYNQTRVKKKKAKLHRTLLLKSSEKISNSSGSYNLALVKFLEYPFTKTTKSISLYSITEDFFEQELNSVFCTNNQFLEDGDTIGLLNLEKEITGDIVQGLPRIEEILEARKKNQVIKRIPSSQKKGLLTQKSSLDQNFEFRKLGTPIKETEKINPHKLLKAYFNYYGFFKPFFCDRQNIVKYARLIPNFEGSYKSFKKVQSFILNSVQNVYQSQGVTINDKHLEVIIKQMTTKVLITDEGDTPLLKREVIDLYHIEYINKIMKNESKTGAYYLPLLFGITRAALNNPSFISAASFQETTRVLTKAAIEGRIDWLRGLKENIIIGHLIPAGTGSRNYKTSFKKSIPNLLSDSNFTKVIQV